MRRLRPQSTRADSRRSCDRFRLRSVLAIYVAASTAGVRSNDSAELKANVGALDAQEPP